MIPFHEFAPMDWKNGTLIFFIRRAITHCSTFHAMHEELQNVTKQFRECGYPASLIASKINITMTKMLYQDHEVPQYPEQNNSSTSSTENQDLPTRWTVLHLPWAGQKPHSIIQQIRKKLPRELSRISIATTATKIRDILPKLDTCKTKRSPLLVRNLSLIHI